MNRTMSHYTRFFFLKAYLKYLRCPQKLNSQYAIAARNELIELIILEGRERDKKSNHIKSQVRT